MKKILAITLLCITLLSTLSACLYDVYEHADMNYAISWAHRCYVTVEEIHHGEALADSYLVGTITTIEQYTMEGKNYVRHLIDTYDGEVAYISMDAKFLEYCDEFEVGDQLKVYFDGTVEGDDPAMINRVYMYYLEKNS